MIDEWSTYSKGKYTLRFPTWYKYFKNHVWVDEQEDMTVIGMTAFLVKTTELLLLNISVDEDEELDRHDTIATVEGGKMTAKISSPLSGKVVAVNQRVVEDPEILEKDPYVDGWLLRVHAKNISKLMEVDQYFKFLDVVVMQQYRDKL